MHEQPPLRVTNTHQDSIARSIRGKIWLLPGIVLLGIALLVIPSWENLFSSSKSPVKQINPPAAFAAKAFFQEYPFPLQGSEAMRPAIDHQGRIWFGDMSHNALVVFDPHTRTFQYLTPPRGHHGIMGIVAAPDDTIWFAEQYANYIGHYFPATRHYQIYPLPWIRFPDQGHSVQQLPLPSAPNELALDAHGEVWFTEFNADRLGRLNPQTGHIQQYQLAAKPSVQILYPYGVTVDPQGSVWFTESGKNTFGRLEPATGVVHVYTVPDPHAFTMEIDSDRHGSLWITSFVPGLLFRFIAGTGKLITYTVSVRGNERSTLYGLLVPTSGDVWVTILAENMLAHLDPRTGRFLYYRIPTAGSLPLGLVMDANQNIWFTGLDKLGMLNPVRSQSRI